MSLPVHIMLSVLLSGANCAEPPTLPQDHSVEGIRAWQNQWERHQSKLETDPQFAHSFKIFKETRDLLIQASNEALEGVYPPKKEMALLRRIERLHKEIAEPYTKGEEADPRKIGIIAFYLLQHLVETETLLVPEESSFGKALETMLPALSPAEGASDEEIVDYDRLNRSAQKQARKILKNLQKEGYYKDIPLPDY